MRWNRLYINNNYNNYPLKDKNLTLDRANKFFTRFFALSLLPHFGFTEICRS